MYKETHLWCYFSGVCVGWGWGRNPLKRIIIIKKIVAWKQLEMCDHQKCGGRSARWPWAKILTPAPISTPDLNQVSNAFSSSAPLKKRSDCPPWKIVSRRRDVYDRPAKQIWKLLGYWIWGNRLKRVPCSCLQPWRCVPGSSFHYAAPIGQATLKSAKSVATCWERVYGDHFFPQPTGSSAFFFFFF